MFTSCSNVFIVNFEQVKTGLNRKKKITQYWFSDGCDKILMDFTHAMKFSYLEYHLTKFILLLYILED